MGRYFGTDGVRGVANRDLTAEFATELAVAAAHVLGELDSYVDQRPTAVVARDPRASGEFLEAAVVAGLASAGVDVHRLGILPTPGTAYLTSYLEADLGVMISASHNPMPDNGIKFFARGGVKLADAIEQEIEHRLEDQWTRPTGADVGRVGDSWTARTTYIEHLVDSITQNLDGLKIVLDCANGAAYKVGPRAFAKAGAEVFAINADPDGLNINLDCGSTHLEPLRQAVLEIGADAGFAFDGDADRCLAVDANGNVIDGDQILAILALARKEKGLLTNNAVVATVMSNLGFLQAMEKHDIKVIQTAVGDRYVLEAMEEHNVTLGGEQSGHVIVRDHATTGDGVLSALLLADRMAQSKKSMQELAAIVTPLPQVLVNVPNVDKARAESDASIAAAVVSAENELGSNGRVLLRPSGTEPLVRVMVEARDNETAQRVAERLADVVRNALAL